MKTNSSALVVPSLAPSMTTNVAATNDIRDIKGPVNILSGGAWLWWTLGAIAAATLAYTALRCWLKKRPKAKPPEILIPPHERARRKLGEALDLIDQPRPFCILVSDTVRLYLEEAFSMRAPERTTEEFLDELQSSGSLSFSQKQSLGDFLMRCDLVKFARHEPPSEQLRELYRSALRLIDETAPAPPAAMAGSTPPAPSSPKTSPPLPQTPSTSSPAASAIGNLPDQSYPVRNRKS